MFVKIKVAQSVRGDVSCFDSAVSQSRDFINGDVFFVILNATLVCH